VLADVRVLSSTTPLPSGRISVIAEERGSASLVPGLNQYMELTMWWLEVVLTSLVSASIVLGLGYSAMEETDLALLLVDSRTMRKAVRVSHCEGLASAYSG